METQIGQIPKSHGSYGKMPPCYNFHIEYRHFGSCHGEPTIRHRCKNTSCFCSGRQLDWRNGGHVVQGMRPVKTPQVQGLSDEVHIHGFKDGHLGIVYVWCVFQKTKKLYIKMCIAGLHCSCIWRQKELRIWKLSNTTSVVWFAPGTRNNHV